MTETSLPWGGTATGDAGPYTDDDWSDVWRKLFTNDRTLQGVIAGYLNELAVSGAATPLTVATGSAIVDGKFYENDAVQNVAIASPAVSTRIDVVVLRKDWAAQTVRIALHAGVEGAGAPALTQTDGVTWEIPLANASITTGGVITLSDRRVMCRTPLGPGYEFIALDVNDATFTAGAWNDIGSTLSFTLTPGVWLLFGGLVTLAVTANGNRRARIYNNTSGQSMVAGQLTLQATEYGTITLAPRIVTITAENEMRLQFYAQDASDQVLANDPTGNYSAMVALRVA